MILSKRVRDLLSHIERGGPEAEIAQRALERLVERHPDYAWALSRDGSAPHSVEVECQTMAHRNLLFVLAGHYGCALVCRTMRGDVWLMRAWLEGPSAIVTRCAEHYRDHSDRIDLLSSYLSNALLDRDEIEQPNDESDECNSGPSEEHDPGPDGENDATTSEERDPDPDDEHDADPDQPDPWFEHEQARIRRMMDLALGSGNERLKTIASRAATMLYPQRSVPLIERAGESVPWDSPDLTFASFVIAWRERYPRSNLSTIQLEGEWRAGRRLNPLTDKLIHVPGLERPWGTPL